MNPLDQLADIATPQDVSMWPLAWGYWLVIVSAAALLVSIVVLMLRYHKKREQKRVALLSLAALEPSDTYFAHKMQVLLKSLMTHYVPHSNSQTLHGTQWQSLPLSVYKGQRIHELSLAIAQIDARMYGNYDPQLPIILSADEGEGEPVSLVQQNETIVNIMQDFIVTSFVCEDINAKNNTSVTSPEEARHV